MLTNDEIRGDTFYQNQQFSYSTYDPEANNKDKKLVSISGVQGRQAGTAPGDDSRSHSIDAACERRPLKKQPSWAEKEALMLLDKISAINSMEKAPK